MPLTGLTVVSIEQAVAAPLATRHLADLGARIIKIERPGTGDFARAYDTSVKGQSSYFVWLNSGKESVTLDLKAPGGREILERLIARADVFVQNLGPGAAARLGTDAAELRARHSRLITCVVTGYGTSGPYANRKAYDLLVQAEAGLLSLTGTADAPARAGISVADIAAGMYAYSGILAALLTRAASGQGASLTVSLFDALAEWMLAPALYTAYGGTPPGRTGPHHASIAPYGPVTTQDGHEVFIAVQNAREWQRFCDDVIEAPGLAGDPRFATNALRVANREALHQAIGTRTRAALARAELLARLDGAGIAWAEMRTIHGLLEHPALAARQRWRAVQTPLGSIRTLRPPVSIENRDAPPGAVPAVGQHTDGILAELGFSPAAITRWRAEGTI